MPTAELAKPTVIPNGEYLDLPIEQAFAWPEIITDIEKVRGSLAAKALYLVVFESTRAEGADPEQIAALDAAAHEEAEESEDLLYYYADTPNEEGRAKSWCLWTDDKVARAATRGPAHREAASHAREFYGNDYAIKLFSVIPHDEGIVFVPHAHPSSQREEANNA